MFRSLIRCSSTAPQARVGVCGIVFWPPKADVPKVLLIQRGKEPKRGLWSLPGGSLEFGESVREATKREMMEECNIDVRSTKVVATSDVFGPKNPETGKPTVQYVLVHSLCEVVAPPAEGYPPVLHGDDADNAEWVSLEDLKRLEGEGKAVPLLSEVVRDALNLHKLSR